MLLLPVLRSDRQYGGNLLVCGKKQGAVKHQIHVGKDSKGAPARLEGCAS